MPHKDPEALRTYQREYQREWKKKNREKVLAAQRAHYHRNKEVYALKARQWRESHPDRHKANFKTWAYSVGIKRKYGITSEQFDDLLKKQNYCCAICREPFTATRNRHIDHCHEQGRVRGILCQRCNLAIGLFRNSPTIALEAAHYLNQTTTLIV